MLVLVLALGGALLIEGAAYALAPGLMKRAMREVLNMPENSLRIGGLAMAVLGVALVWFLGRSL